MTPIFTHVVHFALGVVQMRVPEGTGVPRDAVRCLVFFSLYRAYTHNVQRRRAHIQHRRVRELPLRHLQPPKEQRGVPVQGSHLGAGRDPPVRHHPGHPQCRSRQCRLHRRGGRSGARHIVDPDLQRLHRPGLAGRVRTVDRRRLLLWRGRPAAQQLRDLQERCGGTEEAGRGERDASPTPSSRSSSFTACCRRPA